MQGLSESFQYSAPQETVRQTGYSYGMREVPRWVEAFLKHIRQRVSVNGKSSGLIGVTSGIPQGSVHGPILFVIYINRNMPNGLSSDQYFFIRL